MFGALLVALPPSGCVCRGLPVLSKPWPIARKLISGVLLVGSESPCVAKCTGRPREAPTLAEHDELPQTVVKGVVGGCGL